MRPSKQKTVLAVLRVRIDQLMREAGEKGFSQKEMADLIGRSVATVQSIEIGRQPLTAELAKIVSLKTGASLKWLLDGNPSAPLTGQVIVPDPFEKGQMMVSYKEYALESFKLAKAPTDVLLRSNKTWSELSAQTATARFQALTWRALESEQHAILTWKLQAAVDLLEKEFAELS